VQAQRGGGSSCTGGSIISDAPSRTRTLLECCEEVGSVQECRALSERLEEEGIFYGVGKDALTEMFSHNTLEILKFGFQI